MTNEEILKKAIEKAVENGWNTHLAISVVLELAKDDPFINPYSLIFSHDFAKAFWGEDDYEEVMSGGSSTEWKAWEYHLREMVLEEKPLQYLKKFL